MPPPSVGNPKTLGTKVSARINPFVRYTQESAHRVADEVRLGVPTPVPRHDPAQVAREDVWLHV